MKLNTGLGEHFQCDSTKVVPGAFFILLRALGNNSPHTGLNDGTSASRTDWFAMHVNGSSFGVSPSDYKRIFLGMDNHLQLCFLILKSFFSV